MIYNKDNIEGLQFVCKGSPIVYTVNIKNKTDVVITWKSPISGFEFDIYSKNFVLEYLNNNRWTPINVNYEIY